MNYLCNFALMERQTFGSNLLKIVMPLTLGGAILY